VHLIACVELFPGEQRAYKWLSRSGPNIMVEPFKLDPDFRSTSEICAKHSTDLEYGQHVLFQAIRFLEGAAFPFFVMRNIGIALTFQ